MSRLSEALAREDFVLTAEIGPPRGSDVSAFREKAKSFTNKVVAVNVTDNQRALVKLSSVVGSLILLQEGVEPICQTTCRDRNRIGLQSDLLSAYAMGIENVLALTGDPVKAGDHPDAKPVFEMQSSQLLQLIGTLNAGTDSAGKPLHGTPRIFPGAVINPNANNMDAELRRLERKVAAGARFVQTQAIYDAELFARFAEGARAFNVPILAGILYLRSAKSARFINRAIPGIQIPESMVERLEKASDPEAEGVNIGVELVEAMRPHCRGVHLMSVGAEHRLVDMIDTMAAKRPVEST